DAPRREPPYGGLRELRSEFGYGFEVELHLVVVVPGALDGEGDGDAGDPDHDPLKSRRHRPGVGDVVSQVLSVVYPRDYDVGLEVHEPQSHEPHAIHRRAGAGISDTPVGHLSLLDMERSAKGDSTPDAGAVP